MGRMKDDLMELEEELVVIMFPGKRISDLTDGQCLLLRDRAIYEWEERLESAAGDYQEYLKLKNRDVPK